MLSGNAIVELADGQLEITGDSASNILNVARQEDNDITDATTVPHISIEGTGDGTFDYYSFEVNEADERGIFDIDYENFDTQLFLYDDAGNLLAENDDNGGDPGSGGGTASLIDYIFSTPGAYTIGVGQWPSSDDGGEIDGAVPEEGDVYTLHISLENHALNEGGEDPVAEVEPNHPRAGAQNVDGAGWNLETDETTINGELSPAVFLDSEVVDVVLKTKQGEDLVEIEGLKLAGGISVDTGVGGDSLTIRSVQTAGGLHVDTRQGNDEIVLSISTFGGDVHIETRQGDDSVLIDAAFGDVAFGSNVDINTGQGNDLVDFFLIFSQISFNRDLTIDLGNGDDSARLSTFNGFFGAINIGGDLTINARNGDDRVSVEGGNFVVGGDVGLFGGPGVDSPFDDQVLGDDVIVGGQAIVEGFEILVV
jgi:hypothetical protein